MLCSGKKEVVSIMPLVEFVPAVALCHVSRLLDAMCMQNNINLLNLDCHNERGVVTSM